jgi:hypothetical protein
VWHKSSSENPEASGNSICSFAPLAIVVFAIEIQIDWKYGQCTFTVVTLKLAFWRQGREADIIML